MAAVDSGLEDKCSIGDREHGAQGHAGAARPATGAAMASAQCTRAPRTAR